MNSASRLCPAVELFSNSHNVTTQMSLGSESPSKYVFVLTYLALLWVVNWPLSISYSNHSKELSSPSPSDMHLCGRETLCRSPPSNFLPTWDTLHFLHVLQFLCRDMRNLGFFSRAFYLSSSCECTQLYPTLRPHDCSLPGSSVHGIFQARILEWVAMSFSRSGLTLPL